MGYDKKELLQEEIVSDSRLSSEEKETAMCFPNDLDIGSFYTEVPTMVKWVLSVEESIIKDVKRGEEGEIVGVEARIPKSIVKLQGNARKSTSHSQMVSYGPNK